jgi:hypothetical protein
VSGEVERYDTEYEAYFHLIAVQDPGQHGRQAYVMVAWCLDEACEVQGSSWSVTKSALFDAREAGLEHCREKHVRGK